MYIYIYTMELFSGYLWTNHVALWRISTSDNEGRGERVARNSLADSRQQNTLIVPRSSANC